MNKIVYLLNKEWFIVLLSLLITVLCFLIGKYIDFMNIIGAIFAIATLFLTSMLWDKATGLSDFLMGKKHDKEKGNVINLPYVDDSPKKEIE